MGVKELVVGSRSSRLALRQAELVVGMLKALYPELALCIKTIKTTGDKILDVSLNKIGGKGLFTKEIEEALLKGDIDLAVHSMKDLPTELPPGLKIGAVTKREDPSDALISKQGFSLSTLPKGSKVGTSSLRRRAQLKHKRNDLEVCDLRGNLDTRLKKLEEGLYDALILAYAGIKRLGIKANLSIIPVKELLPQAGQGALAIEIRGEAGEVNDLIKGIDDPDSHLSIDAERALLFGLEGGCQVPIGVHAAVKAEEISITAGVFSLEGNCAVLEEVRGAKSEARALGASLAEMILKRKEAREILSELKKGAK